MIKKTNDCSGCAVPSYPCEKSTCPDYNSIKVTCDKCGDDITDEYIYIIDDNHYCEECAFNKIYSITSAMTYIQNNDDVKSDFMEYMNTTDIYVFFNYVVTIFKTFGEDKFIDYIKQDKQDFVDYFVEPLKVNDLEVENGY